MGGKLKYIVGGDEGAQTSSIIDHGHSTFREKSLPPKLFVGHVGPDFFCLRRPSPLYKMLLLSAAPFLQSILKDYNA
jgi:hypothetical protein